MLPVYGTLFALAEPNRFLIVEFLRKGPKSVGEIVKRLGIRQPQVSKHLAVLSKARLVQVHPSAQKRIYVLQTKPLKELGTWLDQYKELWTQKFDRLDEYLLEMKKEEKKHGFGKKQN
mgnify:CR=1 FL=1